MSETVDLQALVPRRWDEPGIALTVRRVIRLGGGDPALAVDVAARRVSDAGRDLKPRHVITVLGRPDETVGDLLRQLARAFDEPGPIPLVAEEPG